MTAFSSPDANGNITVTGQAKTADPSRRCDVAIKHLLKMQLEEIVRHEIGVRRNDDIEHLHQLRIAVRRIRTLLTQIKHTLAPRHEMHFRDEFAWFGQATGRARDLDVYHESFGDFAKLAGKKRQSALAPLQAYIAEQKVIEHYRLIELLDSERYQTLLQQFDNYLNEPVPRHVAPVNAMRPIGDVSCEYLGSIIKKSQRQAAKLTTKTKAEAFHELRKTCKKVRYLFEFFRDLHPEIPTRKLIKALKQLQQQLGLFQDLQVQQETLRKFHREMDSETLNPEFEAAFDRVLKSLRKREKNMRGQCIAAWHQFANATDKKAFNNRFLNA